MKANIVTSTIEMTKTEAAAAGKLNSAEFADLKQLRETFPTYKIMIVKPAAKKVDHFKGLTLKYMEDYIKRHNKDVLVEFYKLCGKDESGEKAELAATATYGEIKMWFLTEFPEIEEMSDDVNEIIENARASRAARKAS